ncbi:tRNA synthetases class II-domain-containing protein [Annulohypoxylon maeteangense]|uniref:tRNA synthetases class II-domain-containing protein n=1 Tax=Annulohypoxylon maeteangense TaxID=1927788 RepID=UPI00200894AA|nr:tRNA synthetases class II-domain-containing protein [Annulohypoxylon maeteangense]KAI0881587.1 tRNA synthetases class II-domain-containing protein [Annulohypoxylon maeteangense]
MARFLLISLRNNPLRCISRVQRRPLARQCQSIFQLEHTRFIQKEATHDEDIPGDSSQNKVLSFPDEMKKYTFEDPFQIFEESCTLLKDQPPKRLEFEVGQDIVVYGYIGKRKDMRSNFSFCPFEHKDSKADFQIVSQWDDPDSRQYFAHQNLKAIPSYSPVMVMGTVQESKQTATDPLVEAKGLSKVELKLQYIRCLNTFPKDVAVSKDTVWPAKSRHMQLRFDPFLRDRLFFRTWVKRSLVHILSTQEFLEIETPILFKSTPEGAREFLVPTRRQGYAYALPQSPQQYKQTLMAGGIQRYYQFAKCFRDEDHRADRQPEFTQLDLEMAFATGREVMDLLTMMVTTLFTRLHRHWKIVEINGIRHPVRIKEMVGKRDSLETPASPETGLADEINTPEISNRFPRPKPMTIMTYEDAMGRYGSDKPDLRIELPWASNIYQIGENGKGLPSRFTQMISDLQDPVVEGFRFRLYDSRPSESVKFIREFMDNLPNTTLKIGPESVPGVFVYDSSKPLYGLSALGHDGAEVLNDMEDSWPQCEDGDIIIMHARNDEPLSGGSTELGRIRTALYWAAVKQGLIPENHEFKLLWVHGFPLFSPTGDEVGQGGTAGICSTHHPFTAPLNDEDFKNLKTDPLKVRADHYDLVINGVEIGGGSRRIHVAEVQEYVMRDILKMTDEGVSQFSHLIDALRSGCPPHAGFAIGFDRLISVLLDVPSVRDVIAFPKTNRGEDLLVGSPAKVTPEQKKTYHIFEESDIKPTTE